MTTSQIFELVGNLPPAGIVRGEAVEQTGCAMTLSPRVPSI